MERLASDLTVAWLLRPLRSRLQVLDLLDDQQKLDLGCCAYALKPWHGIGHDGCQLSLHLIQELQATQATEKPHSAPEFCKNSQATQATE